MIPSTGASDAAPSREPAAAADLVVRRAAPGDASRVDAFALETPRASFFHCAGWTRAVCDEFGHEDRSLVAERDGRVVGVMLPRMLRVPDDVGGTRDAHLSEFTWTDGELVAGLTLGWNFGDGHLHDERLLGAIQRACGFASGELRCLFVESQPLLGRTLHARVHDAHDGPLHEERVDVSQLLERQPWTLGRVGPRSGGDTGPRAEGAADSLEEVPPAS